MIYLWTIPNNYPNFLLGEYDQENELDRFELKKGKRLDDLPANRPCFFFNCKIEQLKRSHDFGNTTLVPLVSPAAKTIITNICPDDFQFISAGIKCSDGVIDDYSIVVATHKVYGLDHDESTYSKMINADAILGFSKAVYKADCLGGYDAARDAEYLSNLLISERLCTALKELGEMGIYSQDEMIW